MLNVEKFEYGKRGIMKDYSMFKLIVKNCIDIGHVSMGQPNLFLLSVLLSLNVTKQDSGTTLGPSLPYPGRSLP